MARKPSWVGSEASSSSDELRHLQAQVRARPWRPLEKLLLLLQGSLEAVWAQVWRCALCCVQVSKLKASRDKLLEQIDRQWEEMDRCAPPTSHTHLAAWPGAIARRPPSKVAPPTAAELGAHTHGPGTLSLCGSARPEEGVHSACVSCACRLGQENRGLSDELDRAQQLALLWEAQAQGSLAAEERLKDMLEEAAGWSTGGAGNAGAAAASGAASAEAALLNERAKVAELELRVRALAAELMRAQQATMAFGRAVLPTLSGIELRLTNTLAQQQQHAVGKAPGAAAGALQAVH